MGTDSDGLLASAFPPNKKKMSQISFEDSFWVMEQSDYDEFLLFRPLDFLKIYIRMTQTLLIFIENYGF